MANDDLPARRDIEIPFDRRVSGFINVETVLRAGR